MPDSFNPYAEWLGLTRTPVPPNHYQLLGIDPSETDAQRIATAADRASSRVRACKPGAHAALWAQLLDEIAAAKKCLIDPAAKKEYDQNLRSPESARGTADSSPINPNLFPPDVAPLSTLAKAQPAAVVPVALARNAASSLPSPAVPYLQPAPSLNIDPMAPFAVPTAFAPQTPSPMAPVPVFSAPGYAMPTNPMAPMIPGVAPVLDPMAPMVPVAVPVQVAPLQPTPIAGVPYAAVPAAFAQPLAAFPVQAAPVLAAAAGIAESPAPATDPFELPRATSTSALPKRRVDQGWTGPIAVGGSVGVLILSAIFLVYYFNNSTKKTDALAAVNPAPATDAPEVNGSGDATTSDSADANVTESPSEEPPASETVEPTPSEPEMVAPESTPEPTPPVTPSTPNAEPMPATMPAPEPTPPEMSREDLKAAAQALTAARDAISGQDFALAATELAKAEALAKTDEVLAKVTRLKLLADYAGRYRAALDQTLSQLQAGEEIMLDPDRFLNVVENSPTQIVVRLAGQNYRYTRSDMPLGLVTRFADMSLDKDSPDAIAMKAAFVSVSPKANEKDLAKVREWWAATTSVSDVPELIAAINDDYSLREDLAAVPLDQNAMQQLLDRTDKLKASQKLEDFAAEYQAAITAALQSVEPGAELEVGESTAVTVKELKDNRLMIETAGMTRGYAVDKLPLGLAAALAERTLPPDAPLTMVMKGAFYAAREKDSKNKQFRALVLNWWKEAGELDKSLQPAIQELVKQYPE